MLVASATAAHRCHPSHSSCDPSSSLDTFCTRQVHRVNLSRYTELLRAAAATDPPPLLAVQTAKNIQVAPPQLDVSCFSPVGRQRQTGTQSARSTYVWGRYGAGDVRRAEIISSMAWGEVKGESGDGNGRLGRSQRGARMYQEKGWGEGRGQDGLRVWEEHICRTSGKLGYVVLTWSI